MKKQLEREGVFPYTEDSIYHERRISMKYRCKVCGHIYDEEVEGVKFEDLPDDWKCPTCGVPKSMFEPVAEEAPAADNAAPVEGWACEHVLGTAEGLSDEVKDGLRACFQGECGEVGMYLAMARVAIREGYPEVGAFFEKAAWEEAEHAALFAEMLGEVLTDSTKENLKMRAEAEKGATKMRADLAKLAKEAGNDPVHDAVHEIGRDEARHGKAFEGLLKRYFGE